jgi:hypothetical protein
MSGDAGGVAAPGIPTSDTTQADAPAPPVARRDTTPVRMAGLVARGVRPRREEVRGAVVLNRMEVITTPGNAGDVLHSVKMHGGLTQASDGSDLFVRGGDPAEAPIFLDGARMVSAGSFESLHGGLFGVLNPAVVRDLYFSSGGFSARYGNALSGVLDVRTEGRPASRSLSLGASVAGVSATARLPITPKVGAWGTARATDASLLLAMQGQSDDFTRSPRALEGTFGIAAEPRRGLELKAVALMEGDGAERTIDSYGWRGPFRSSGQNGLLALSGRAVRQRDGAQVRATLSASHRASGFAFGVLDRDRTDRNLGVSVDAALPVAGATLRFGAEAARLTAREEGSVPTTGVVAPGSPAEALAEGVRATGHLGAFVEGEVVAGNGMTVSAGVRADRLPGEDAWTVDPRLSAAYRHGDWTVRLGGGIFHQGRWRIRQAVPGGGAPTGTPREARHLALGVERGGPTSLRLEAYVKEYGDYVAAGEGERIVAGRAAGVDAVARWTGGERLSGWLTYSFLHSRVETEGGASVPTSVDVTHSLTGVGKLALGPSTELGVTARYGTGRPYTPVAGATETEDGRWTPEYGAANGARVPDYFRVDARLTRMVNLRGQFLVGYLEVLNLLGRRNTMGYTYDATWRERTPVESFFSRRVAVLGAEIQIR